jgi:PAS domain S-box-containing protein
MQKILIADDNDDNLYYLQALLGASGYEVLTAKNGAEALECALATPPDLMISDILMPGMDGFALCRRWRSEPGLATIPFVFYTATYTDPKDRELGLSIGADDFLVKPMEPGTLLQIARGLLRQKEMGTLPDRFSATAENSVYLREYNAALIRKLEDKVKDLDAAYQRLEESERRFRGFFNDAVVGFYRTTADGRVLLVNPSLGKMLGYDSPEDILGVDIENSHFPAGYPREDFKKELEEKGVIRGQESAWKRRDGSTLYIRENVRATRDSAGRIVHYEGTVEDITARKQAEEKSAKLQAELLQSQKMEAVGRLAGGIAHDFNNLLMVIMAQTEMLALDLDLEGASAQRAEKIMKASRRAAELTGQLLAFSRKQTTQPTVTSMNQLVTGVSDMLQRLVGEDVDVQVSFCDEPWLVKTDRAQFEQVIMNLVVNARDALPNGGMLTLETGNSEIDEEYIATHPLVPAGNYAMLAVTDTGTGMSAEVQARLFEPFFTTKEPGKGTGLGLSMVYGIVKQSGGFIRVYSELGKGTCFKIYLPKANVSQAATPEEHAAPTHPLKKKATILLVEDDDSLRDVIANFLQTGGHKVIVAESLDEACRVALEERLEIDLLLTDVVLKGGNGKQLVHRLEGQGCVFRVVYMSGYTPNAIMHHGVLDPGMLFLQKPFSQAALLDKLEKALSTEG